MIVRDQELCQEWQVSEIVPNPSHSSVEPCSARQRKVKHLLQGSRGIVRVDSGKGVNESGPDGGDELISCQNALYG